MSEVKVYYAMYNGMANNPTEELLTFVEKKRLKQPLYSGGGNNGFVRLVKKSDYDSQSLTIRQLQAENEKLKVYLEAHVRSDYALAKLKQGEADARIKNIYKEIEAAKKAVK